MAGRVQLNMAGREDFFRGLEDLLAECLAGRRGCLFRRRGFDLVFIEFSLAGALFRTVSIWGRQIIIEQCQSGIDR